MTDKENREEQTVDLSRRTVLRTALVAGGMFGFGFAMVPIYDVFCKVTGLNGKTDPNPYTGKAEMDTSRIIKVQFVATKNAGMIWDFHPDISEVEVHPGQVGELSFYARNPTSERMIGQAIPSVTPFQATNYLHKVECFCFTTQTLDAGEEKVMPLRIIVDQELPRHITKLTLSYTLFDVTTMGERTLKS
ncbi:cytochrome c oxidase assembly protein [Endozoicomonas euniceicola]|uniref:Cytochrome c oxidase assembly protein CtaG n=1 Tax=Endozoicomonas euniceicola TaxID=1234143 RepID=A0ABY6H229_9GAMM|nr:cytochrome c oxidase assembly protein [Endozoicomonas euniceicola]UYM18331.1 cytochrome c oxidase assembly protein [Endozoicomonas euniceicola]